MQRKQRLNLPARPVSRTAIERARHQLLLQAIKTDGAARKVLVRARELIAHGQRKHA